MANTQEQLALAIQHHQAGRLQAAEQVCQQILAFEPNHASAMHVLGVIAHQTGKHEVAVQYIGRAVKLNANVAAFHNNLGGAYHALSRIHEAVACYRRALELQPALAEAHNNLGYLLIVQGKLDEAVASCRRALQLKPDYAVAHNNLGNALNGQGKLEEAAASYRRALELNPKYAVAHNNLGNALNDRGRLDEAVACYRRALELNPGFSAAHYNLGAHYQQIGDFERAQCCWREALLHDPLHSKALIGLALLPANLPIDELAVLTRLASSPEMPAGNRASMHFGIANIMDALGDYAAAAQHLADANSLSLVDRQMHGQAYDSDAHDRLITAVIDTFSPTYFERVRGFGVVSERPVFIFGLPRTGTTLTEQILAGHTKVFGAGELQLARIAFDSLPQITTNHATPLECVAAVDQQVVELVARRYLERLEAFDNCALRIVDKMPDNYLHVGFLMTLFPKARFIHCRRDLRDVAVSCWMTELRRMDWSNDIDHIASRFRAYERLMGHWRQVLPMPMLDVDYEAIVADLEGTARRLVDWCGLDWEPNCLLFHTRRDPVRTASAIQVRQPIYQHAVGRWKRYSDVLAPLLAAVNRRHETKFHRYI